MSKITVSSPGKLMLLGDHAVVYGRPCIVTAVDHRLSATLTLLDKPVLQLEASDLDLQSYSKDLERIGIGQIPKAAQFVEMSVFNWKQRYGLEKGVQISTKSEFSASFGFGSSSAATVCTIGGLNELLGTNLSKKEIFDLAYKTVLDVQGKGSGFDIAAATFGGTLYYQNGGEIIEELPIENLPLVVGYTGVKYSTVKVLDEVLELGKKFPDLINGIYDDIHILVDLGKKALLQNDLANFGKIMNFNQGELEKLGVGCLELAKIIYAGRKMESLGAKLSGAGKGDCAICLTEKNNKKQVEEAIIQQGFEIIPIKASSPGFRVESNN